MSFYRIDQDGIFMRAGKFVYAPTYTLLAEDHATYTYPTEGGWYWFETTEEARTFFGLDEDVYLLE